MKKSDFKNFKKSFWGRAGGVGLEGRGGGPVGVVWVGAVQVRMVRLPVSVAGGVGAPKGGGPEISRFFFLLSRHNVRSFCLSGGLLGEFWWCLKRRDHQMCTFGEPKRSHRAKMVAGEGKTREILGGPAEEGPGEGGRAEDGPGKRGSGAPINKRNHHTLTSEQWPEQPNL